jgi:hypothetical protein
MDDFREQCRRGLKRSLADRFKYGFFRNHNPVLDDERNRVFNTMREYREWADRELQDIWDTKSLRKMDRSDRLHSVNPNCT